MTGELLRLAGRGEEGIGGACKGGCHLHTGSGSSSLGLRLHQERFQGVKVDLSHL